MGFLSVFLLVIFVIASLLLIGVVLIQDDQGEGLGGLFGGGATSFGSRSGNILTRFTSILAATFLICAFVLAWLNKTPEAGDVLGAARRGAAEESTVDEWWVIDDESDSSQRATNPATPVGYTMAGCMDTPVLHRRVRLGYVTSASRRSVVVAVSA